MRMGQKMKKIRVEDERWQYRLNNILPPVEAGLLASLMKKIKSVIDRTIRSFSDFFSVVQDNGFLVLDLMGTQKTAAEPTYFDAGQEVSYTAPRWPQHPSEMLDPELDPDARILMACKNMLKFGNHKIDSKIGIWTLPCQETCPASTEFCRKHCYARKSQFWKSVYLSRRQKYFASLQEDFVGKMVNAVTKAKSPVIRVHESGDIYSEEYLFKWIDIARQCPATRFYFYTKALDIVNKVEDVLTERKESFPDNMVFNFSVEPYVRERVLVRERGKDKGRLEVQEIAGTSAQKVRKALNDPLFSGLAITMPKGGNALDTLSSIGLEPEEIKEIADKLFICPYVECQGCGSPDHGRCSFCYLTKEEREHYNIVEALTLARQELMAEKEAVEAAVTKGGEGELKKNRQRSRLENANKWLPLIEESLDKLTEAGYNVSGKRHVAFRYH